MANEEEIMNQEEVTEEQSEEDVQPAGSTIAQKTKGKNELFGSWFNVKRTKGKLNLGMLGIMLTCFVVSIIIMLSIGVLGTIIIVAKNIIDAQGAVTDVMPIN